MRCAENQTRNSSLFLETQKSKPYPSPKIKIQNLDEKEVSDQRYILTKSLILSHNGHRFIRPTQLQPYYYYRKKKT